MDVVDIKMPVADGSDVLRWARQHPDSAVLTTMMLSSSDDDKDVRLAYELGANASAERVERIYTFHGLAWPRYIRIIPGEPVPYSYLIQKATVMAGAASAIAQVVRRNKGRNDMNTRLHRPSLAAHAAMTLALTLVLGSPTAFAGKKPGGGGGGAGGGGITNTTTKPPTPTNFRVTAKTAYTISVAWDAATSSTDFDFYLSGTRATPAILPSTARSHTFTALAPGNDYWLFIYTKDASGNAGGQANLGPVLLPRDTTPPSTAPVVSIGEVGANYAHLSWTRAQDDGPYHYSYELWINGSLLYKSDYPRDVTNTVLRFLQPATTYAVQIRTIDFGGNPSPLSDPVSLTTLPANPNDTTPPTVPAPVFAYSFGDLEMELSWGQSTDDFDAQANIRYDVYVNGRFEDVVFGSGGPRVIYGTGLGENLIEVFATDTAGNTSAAGTFRIFL